MSYSIYKDGEPTPLRFIGIKNGRAKLMKPFTPVHWEHDACAPPQARYLITWPAGSVSNHRWYEVITCEDSVRDILVKVKHINRIQRAEETASTAVKELRDLRGY